MYSGEKAGKLENDRRQRTEGIGQKAAGSVATCSHSLRENNDGRSPIKYVELLALPETYERNIDEPKGCQAEEAAKDVAASSRLAMRTIGVCRLEVQRMPSAMVKLYSRVVTDYYSNNQGKTRCRPTNIEWLEKMRYDLGTSEENWRDFRALDSHFVLDV